MPKVCVVYNCRTGTKGIEEKRSLFKPPWNEELKKKWEDAIPKLKQLKPTQCVCERHFLPKHVHKKWIKYGKNGNVIAEYDYPRPRLDPRAIPCIFDEDKPITLSDAWLVYKKRNSTPHILTSSDLNEILMNTADSPEESSSTIQAICSTREHDYCRSELNPSENDRNKDNPRVMRTESSNFQVELPKSTNFRIQGQKIVNSSTQVEKGTISLSKSQKSIDSQSQAEQLINIQESISVNIQSQKPTNFQIHTTKPSVLQVQGHQSTTPHCQEKNLSVSDAAECSDELEIKEEVIEQSMEVEDFLDTFIQPNSTVSSATSQENQQITLSTPSGLSEQLMPTTKSQRITLVESNKEVSTSPPEDENPQASTNSPDKSALRLETGGVYEDGEQLSKLPYTWSASELVTNKGKQIIFSHVIQLSHNNVETPLLKKAVVVEQRTGKVSYYAHGRIVDVSKTKLPKTTLEITSLPIALYTFQKMRICGGVTLPNKTPVVKEIYQDLMQCWRHNDCKLLVERGKCEPCSKLQKTLAQKRRRAEKSSGSLRISSSWDPRDQIAVLKKKLALEKRKKKNAQAQVRKLTEATKENGVKVRFVKNIKL